MTPIDSTVDVSAQIPVPPHQTPDEPRLPEDSDQLPGRPEPVAPPQPIDPPSTTPPIELPSEPPPNEVG